MECKFFPLFALRKFSLVLRLLLKEEYSAKRDRDLSQNPVAEKEKRFMLSKLRRFPTTIQNMNLKFFNKKGQY